MRGRKKNPDKHRILNKGEKFGFKTIIAFVHTIGPNNIYDVENTCCGRVTRITQNVILKGRQCNECRRKIFNAGLNAEIKDHQQRRFEW